MCLQLSWSISPKSPGQTQHTVITTQHKTHDNTLLDDSITEDEVEREDGGDGDEPGEDQQPAQHGPAQPPGLTTSG